MVDLAMFTESSKAIGYSSELAVKWLALMELSEIARRNFVQWMESEGRKQKWVAQRLGVTENTVSRWKKGKLELSLNQIGKIADLTGIPAPFWFIEGGIEAPMEAAKALADQVRKS